MPEISEKDLLKTGPGTLAGRYLKTFWQPIAVSADLAKGKTRPVRVMAVFALLIVVCIGL